MIKAFKQTGGMATGISAFSIGLGLLSTSPAQASLIGDEVTLDLQFYSDAPAPMTVGTNISIGFGGGATPQSTTVLEGGPFLEFPIAEGVASTTGEFGDRDFTGEEPFSAVFSNLNIEDNFIEGETELFWGLLDSSVASFSWAYTVSDLDWVDFPDGSITDASLSSVEGSATGQFFAPGVTGSFDTDFGALLSLDFSADSVTLAINVDPTAGSALDFSTGSGAFGSARGAFRIDLAVDHGPAPTDVPEPTALIGLLLGSVGLASLKRR